MDLPKQLLGVKNDSNAKKKPNNTKNACRRQHPKKENLDMFKYMIAYFIYVHI